MNGSNKKRSFTSLQRKQTRAGYVFVLPVVIGLVFLFIPMVAQTVYFSLSNVKITTTGYTTSFMGLYQYVSLLTTDAWYMQNAVASLGSVLLDFFTILIFSFFVSVLLNQKFKGRTLARMIFFLPVILATGIIATLDSKDTLTAAVAAGTGLDIGRDTTALLSVSELLENAALPAWLVTFIAGLIDQLNHIISASGVQILLFLAGLQAISPQIYEAAHVEGATGWEAFWKITLPMISPVIQVNGIYTLIDSCTSSTNVIMSQVLSDTMQMSYSKASAEAILYLLAVSLFIVVFLLVSNKLVFYQE